MGDKPDSAGCGTGPAATASASATLRRSVLAALACGALLVWAGLHIGPSPYYFGNLMFLTRLFLVREDAPVAAGMGLVLAGLVLWRRAGDGGRLPVLSARSAGLMLVAMVLGIWLIRLLVLFDHDFTRDEQMATMDAAIFASGRLFQPFPAALRDYYPAFNSLFLLPVADRSAWVSAYLPVNALIRAAAGAIVPASLISPLLTGLAGLLLWRIARRLWPDDRAAPTVVLLCFAGSAQVVLMGTATFAMSTHLALNLAWLACFLRGGRAGLLAALAIGLFATGIHQPVFHPLFVLPFLDLLRRQRRWRELAGYVAGYGAIGLFWLAWPHWVLAQIGPGAAVVANQAGLVDRLAGILVPPNADALWVMAANVVRFGAWQHLLVIPLALVAVRKCAPRDDLARALALGVVAVLAAMTVLMPPQGHGWGYRYLHGLIGSICLLAGYGWRWLAARGAAPGRAMVATTAVSLLVLLPLHVWTTRGYVAPAARAVAEFRRTDADLLVFESGRIPFDTNFVINAADLSNRPLVLLGDQIRPDELARLCRGRSVAFADAPRFNAVRVFYEDPPLAGAGVHQATLKLAAERAGCRIVPLGSPRADGGG